MLRNLVAAKVATELSFLNEVLSLNAQEFDFESVGEEVDWFSSMKS